MSRAFLNEDKFELAGDELIERPVSAHPNYVTPQGAKELQTAYEKLLASKEALRKTKDEDAFARQKLAEVERDLRYFKARLESALLIVPAQQNKELALFGATVGVEDEEGKPHTFIIVGEDEADIAQHKVSVFSPIASALIGRKIGETVTWQRPAGNMQLEIISIDY